jgi:hypothetical protein
MKKFIPSMSDISEGFYFNKTRAEAIAEVMEANLPLIEDRIEHYIDNWEDHPLVGEFILNHDGSYDRFTHDWGEKHGIQTGGIGGSFYLSSNGWMEYSGGLNSSEPYSSFELLEERKDAFVWSFDRDQGRAHNGIYYHIPARVWRRK